MNTLGAATVWLRASALVLHLTHSASRSPSTVVPSRRVSRRLTQDSPLHARQSMNRDMATRARGIPESPGDSTPEKRQARQPEPPSSRLGVAGKAPPEERSAHPKVRKRAPQ